VAVDAVLASRKANEQKGKGEEKIELAKIRK
jgi:hypothetical protein